ncbi:MAG: hypothetical protein PVI30_25260 [Myxococcales bacterium]|jgi:hypothetical protein
MGVSWRIAALALLVACNSVDSPEPEPEGQEPGALSGASGECDVDDDCDFGNCFEGQCVGVGEEGGHCDINCGVPRGTKPPPWSCNGCLACVEERCVRCEADEDCWPYLCDQETGACEQIELPADAGLDQPEACDSDDDCGPLPDNPAWERFCDLGVCTPLSYDPFVGHGQPCPHPTAECTPEDCCFPFACIEGRCRSCTDDGQCGPGMTCTDGQCH